MRCQKKWPGAGAGEGFQDDIIVSSLGVWIEDKAVQIIKKEKLVWGKNHEFTFGYVSFKVPPKYRLTLIFFKKVVKM